MIEVPAYAQIARLLTDDADAYMELVTTSESVADVFETMRGIVADEVTTASINYYIHDRMLRATLAGVYVEDALEAGLRPEKMEILYETTYGQKPPTFATYPLEHIKHGGLAQNHRLYVLAMGNPYHDGLRESGIFTRMHTFISPALVQYAVSHLFRQVHNIPPPRIPNLLAIPPE